MTTGKTKKHILGLALAAAVATPAVATPALADDGKSAGDLMVRARAILVEPDVGSVLSIGGEAEIENTVVPELDFTYFLTDNVGVELILATTKHDVSAVNTVAGDVDLGSIWLLPPTVTLQYHFNPKNDFSPYIGAGLNYTVFYNDDLPNGIVTDIDYENGFGLAIQAGFDYRIKDSWYINLDVKKLLLNTDVSLNGGTISADVDIDPWIIGVGVGRKF